MGKKTYWILKQCCLSYCSRGRLPLDKKIVFEKNISACWDLNTIKTYAKKHKLSVGSVLMGNVIIAIQKSLSIKNKKLRIGTIAFMPPSKGHNNRFGYVHLTVPCDKDAYHTAQCLRKKMRKIYQEQATGSDAAFRSIHQYPAFLTHRILKTLTEKIDVVFSYLPINRKTIKIGGHPVTQHQLFSTDPCNPFFIHLMVCGDKINISTQVNTELCDIHRFEEYLQRGCYTC